MIGVGKASLDKLRALEDAGGWLDSGEYFERFKGTGNRLPFLMFTAEVVESFSYCPVENKNEPEHSRTRVGYRLTDKGRELLSREGDLT